MEGSQFTPDSIEENNHKSTAGMYHEARKFRVRGIEKVNTYFHETAIQHLKITLDGIDDARDTLFIHVPLDVPVKIDDLWTGLFEFSN